MKENLKTKIVSWFISNLKTGKQMTLPQVCFDKHLYTRGLIHAIISCNTAILAYYRKKVMLHIMAPSTFVSQTNPKNF